jgi:hypothetical protein
MRVAETIPGTNAQAMETALNRPIAVVVALGDEDELSKWQTERARAFAADRLDDS